MDALSRYLHEKDSDLMMIAEQFRLACGMISQMRRNEMYETFVKESKKERIQKGLPGCTTEKKEENGV